MTTKGGNHKTHLGFSDLGTTVERKELRAKKNREKQEKRGGFSTVGLSLAALKGLMG